MHTLSASDKCQITNKEIEQINASNERQIRLAEKQLAQLQAEIEVAVTDNEEKTHWHQELIKDFAKQNTPKMVCTPNGSGIWDWNLGGMYAL